MEEKIEKENTQIDDEDVIQCDCYIIFCVAKNGGIFTDRVYINEELAEKRITYLNLVSGGRGDWFAAYSQIAGKKLIND